MDQQLDVLAVPAPEANPRRKPKARAALSGVCGYILKDGPAVDAAPADCATRIVAELQDIAVMDREHFVAFYLNARQQVIVREVISVGTLSASLVHPREVFKPAILNNAAGLVVAHNHPSGDTTPSAEDKTATRRLKQAGELLGIPLLDHVIVAPRGASFSFHEGGIL